VLSRYAMARSVGLSVGRGGLVVYGIDSVGQCVGCGGPVVYGIDSVGQSVGPGGLVVYEIEQYLKGCEFNALSLRIDSSCSK